MSEKERSISSKEDDLFHAVAMGEQSTWEKGYAEGVEHGHKKGFEDGFKLGTQKGTELGNEVGFYGGYASYVLKLIKNDSTRSSRVQRLCQSILEQANTFSTLEPTDETLSDNLKKLQSKFRQLTSLLAVRVEYQAIPGSSVGLSF